MITVLKSKLHRATVTGADLNYEGSITIDPAILEAAKIREYEQVHVVNINNGERFVTYAIESPYRYMGVICVNGAAARLVQPGDKIIVMAFRMVDETAIIEPIKILFPGNTNLGWYI